MKPFAFREMVARARAVLRRKGLKLGQVLHTGDIVMDRQAREVTRKSGLGLAIVRALVEAQGGTIAVESTVGAGTCFTITIPALAHATARVTHTRSKSDLAQRKVPVGNKA